ncbi:serine hydrolase domain-containing protein [Cryptosporangium sp. NPDC048952]|uniref:serine hydrolase domain-containing protein n=1 Tax=Cryptosporangium sp. NPDC048952 TaxID=3363961 RepID=UPI0037125060
MRSDVTAAEAQTVLLHALAALLLAVPAAPVPDRPLAVDAESIDTAVRAYRETTRIPGIAVAVTHGLEVVHAAGYGTTAGGDPVTDHTLMSIASLSKSITALAVLQLVDDGRVRLDAPVHTYLPEFTMADDRAATITARQLLNHTSGLSDATVHPFSGPAVHSLREAVSSLRTARLATEPGTRFEYHNPNYQVAARLVEVVSRQPFDEYLRRNVFGPLGMRDSRTGDTADELPRSGRGHRMLAGFAVTLPEPPAFGNGSGGVLSTARDMAAWLIAQNDRGRGPDGTPIVSSGSLTEMHSRSVGSYGLGWEIDETSSGAPLIHHTGGLITITGYQALLPDSGYGLVVLANSGSQYGDASALGAQLVDLIEGRPTSPANSPTALIGVDVVLLLLTLVTALLAGRAVRRCQQWSENRRRALTTAARLIPYLLPSVLLVSLHRIASYLYRGMDISWRQAVYLQPGFTLLLVTSALAGMTVLVFRLVCLYRRRNTSATPRG